MSNPEKKRKYDLQFFSRTSGPQTSSSTKSYGEYTGNAYQYAQQQAYFRQKNQHQGRTTQKPPAKKDPWDNYYVLISVGVAMILLYLIISYSNSKNELPESVDPSKQPLTEQSEAPLVETAEPEPQIHEFDSPYSAIFGEEVADLSSKNSITLHNSSNAEAVVCLVENKKPFRTLRNQYMNSATTFKMNNIPNGDYFLKVYFGTNWDSTKVFPHAPAHGGFKTDIGFVKMNTGEQVLRMKQEKIGESNSYSSFEILLDPNEKDHAEMIRSDEFFR